MPKAALICPLTSLSTRFKAKILNKSPVMMQPKYWAMQLAQFFSTFLDHEKLNVFQVTLTLAVMTIPFYWIKNTLKIEFIRKLLHHLCWYTAINLILTDNFILWNTNLNLKRSLEVFCYFNGKETKRLHSSIYKAIKTV